MPVIMASHGSDVLPICDERFRRFVGALRSIEGGSMRQQRTVAIDRAIYGKNRRCALGSQWRRGVALKVNIGELDGQVFKLRRLGISAGVYTIRQSPFTSSTVNGSSGSISAFQLFRFRLRRMSRSGYTLPSQGAYRDGELGFVSRRSGGFQLL